MEEDSVIEPEEEECDEGWEDEEIAEDRLGVGYLFVGYINGEFTKAGK
jgi:hypothetical protein